MKSGSQRDTAASLHLGVMAKYWEPGRVKTRLGASIGMQQAAAIHRSFCRHLANGLLGAADEQSFVITPSARRTDFSNLLPAGWSIELQADGDLGSRMQAWFAGEGAAPQPVDRVLIGADCPTLGKSIIAQTRRKLEDHDVVLGLAIDGGYYLIALAGGWRAEYSTLLEDVPWSSDQVYSTTCDRAREAGLRLATLDPLEDIDTIAELDRMREWLREQPADSRHVPLRDAIDRIMSGEDEL